MKDMEKELKMKLLEQLMEEMDGYSAKRLKPEEEPMVEVVEQSREEMPLEDAEAMLKDKLMGDSEEEDEEMSELPSEEDMMDEDEDDDEDEEYSSNMMRRMQELRKARKE